MFIGPLSASIVIAVVILHDDDQDVRGTSLPILTTGNPYNDNDSHRRISRCSFLPFSTGSQAPAVEYGLMFSKAWQTTVLFLPSLSLFIHSSHLQVSASAHYYLLSMGLAAPSTLGMKRGPRVCYQELHGTFP